MQRSVIRENNGKVPRIALRFIRAAVPSSLVVAKRNPGNKLEFVQIWKISAKTLIPLRFIKATILGYFCAQATYIVSDPAAAPAASAPIFAPT